MARKKAAASVPALRDSAPPAQVVDTLTNVVSGVGTSIDKTMHAQFVFRELPKHEVEMMYRGDWVSRKVVDAPAEDSTREWRSWQAEGDQIEAIEEAERLLCVRQRVLRALKLARLYGGAALVLGVRGSGDARSELVLESLGEGCLEFVHAVHKYELSAQSLITDLTSKYYGQPEYYTRSTPEQGTIEIHPSRVIRFVGREIPDPTIAPDGWGDSILQAVEDAVRASGIVNGGIAALVQEAKVDVIRVPGLTEKLTTKKYSENLVRRFGVSQQLKSLVHTLVMDKDEEWARVQASFASLPDIIKMYLLIASAAADIPATRMLSQSPVGFNASGESDTRNYYDRVASDQNTTLTPALERLDEILIRHATGDRDKDIFYEWNPLWQMTDAEKADIAAKEASTFAVDANMGLINPEVLREARVNQLIERGTYPGLEVLIDQYGSEPEEPDDEEILAQFQELQSRQKQLFPPEKANGGGQRALPKDES